MFTNPEMAPTLKDNMDEYFGTSSSQHTNRIF